MFILEIRRVHVVKNYSQLSSRGHLDINMQVYVHVLFFLLPSAGDFRNDTRLQVMKIRFFHSSLCTRV